MSMNNQRSASKSSIEKLVRFFEKNIYQLKSPSFNETQARQQLIDPFFEALGWDVHNRKMNPLYLQEVMPEGRVKTNVGKEVKEQEVLFEKKGTLGKAHKEYASILDYIAEDNYKASWKEAIKKPDYRFRIKGQTKFFVEAKKPFVDLSKSAEAIFQVKRYGFSGRVPVSILTDFEQFRTFDCTRRPEFDKPKLGVIKELDLTYVQYLDQFDQIYDTFSHDAVEAGSLDTLTRKLLQKKTGDFALDKHFLEDLSAWREELARDIAKHPKNRRRLTDYTLNESVQRILDRIVFFRVCEDREIEVENTLLAILRLWQGRPGVSLYSLLNDLFKQRRALYNGLLFAPHECEELEVGDDVLLKILEGLNYPFSPYYFNEIGVEILGSIYEKFLGKTIHLTPKTVRVDEKPEVRKAGGVYYTPQYIVNYIVDNTLGKLLYEDAEGNGGKRKLKLSPKQVSKLRIIDIACGSGSFLLGAFQKLTDYHLEWYREHPKDVESVHNVPDAYGDANGTLRLSSRKKRDILLNNIYGVDIDRQAVEVTQMSLYLKVLEGENAETLNPQMMLALKEAYLPSLGGNIKCGNSLIGTDISAQSDLFDSESTQKINPFDWESEFSEIMNRGGFDCVIGNPPYGARFSEPEKEYLFAKYPLIVGQPESYEYFMLIAINLLRKSGHLSFINPNNFIESDRSEGLRKALLEAGTIRKISNFRYRIWKENASETLVFVFEKGTKGEESLVTHPASEEDFLRENDAVKCNQKDWEDSPKTRFLVRANLNLIRKIEKRSVQLGELCNAGQGIIVYKTRLESEKNPYISSKRHGGEWKKLLDTESTIQRYALIWGGRYLKYGKWLWRPREAVFFESPKILLVRLRNKSLVRRIVATYDDEKYYNRDNFNNVILKDQKHDLKYILGVLNSLLVNYWYKSYFDNVNINPEQISLIPVRPIDFSNPSELSVHKGIVGLVERMLELNSQLQSATFDSEKEPIQRQIAATDKKIDKLVYELYGLTEEEIKIVEGGN
jgi:type I restriction-modification system DNA methylase subunit